MWDSTTANQSRSASASSPSTVWRCLGARPREGSRIRTASWPQCGRCWRKSQKAPWRKKEKGRWCTSSANGKAERGLWECANWKHVNTWSTGVCEKCWNSTWPGSRLPTLSKNSSFKSNSWSNTTSNLPRPWISTSSWGKGLSKNAESTERSTKLISGTSLWNSSPSLKRKGVWWELIPQWRSHPREFSLSVFLDWLQLWRNTARAEGTTPKRCTVQGRCYLGQWFISCTWFLVSLSSGRTTATWFCQNILRQI